MRPEVVVRPVAKQGVDIEELWKMLAQDVNHH